jgi:hypothetical protein
MPGPQPTSDSLDRAPGVGCYRAARELKAAIDAARHD